MLLNLCLVKMVWCFDKMFLIKKRGQVWVETVIYTLIGIALIGLVLAILTPKIKEFRDRSVIEQTIESLNVFDSKVVEVLDAPANKRKVTLGLDRGIIFIDTLNDSILYVLDESNVRYSEPGVSLDIGRLNVSTTALTESYKITLSLHYPYNITFNGEDSIEPKQFTPVSVPYEFFIENRGIIGDINNRVLWIDITEGN